MLLVLFHPLYYNVRGILRDDITLAPPALLVSTPPPPDECKRVVEVSVSSYHGANAFREDLVHGFILVYSAKRRASLSALKAFSSNIPNLPIQVSQLITCATPRHSYWSLLAASIPHNSLNN